MQAITAYDLVRHWDEIAALLAPAVATDTRSMSDVKIELITGDMHALKAPGGIVVVSMGRVVDVDNAALWVLYAAGKSSRAEYRQLIEEVASNARFSGCTELRIEGRRAAKWARVLGGFEHVSGQGDDAVYRRLLNG